MSLLHLDSFNYYGASTAIINSLLETGPYIKSFTNIRQDTSPVAIGRASLGLQDNTGFIQVGIPDISTIITGFSFYANEVLSTQGANTIIAFFYGVAGTETAQVNIILNDDGSITAKNGDGTTLGSSSAGVMSSSVWIYVEVKILFSETIGTVEVRVNGIPEIELTDGDQDTVNGVAALINSVRLGKTSLDWNANNFYICDNSGSKFNDFLNPVIIETLKPIGVGTNTDWTPSTGNNWENVDDDYPSQSSSNNESSISGNLDSHEMSNLSTIVNVLAVGSIVTGIVPFGGLQPIKHFILSDNGSNTTSSNITFNASETSSIIIYEDVPGGSNWTAANVNTLESGYQTA